MPDDSAQPEAPAGTVVTGRRVAALVGGLVTMTLLALAGRDAVTTLASLAPRSAEAGWLGGSAWPLMWLAAPATLIGAIAMTLAPGLLAALALDRARSVEEWVLYAFPLSLVLVSVPTALAQGLAGMPIRGGAFAGAVAVGALPALAALLFRLRRGTAPRWPLGAPGAAGAVIVLLVVPWLLLGALGPKFHWEAFNGDGAHAFEASRLLLHQAVPFWDPAAGEVAAFPGITSFAFTYPVSWFIRLFGAIEVSARAPYLLFLMVAAAGVATLAGWARARPLGTMEHALLWLALVPYTLVVAFSTTYEPYSADLALPATQDTMVVAAFLAFAHAAVRRDWRWAAPLALVTHLTLPNGLLLLGFWAVAWGLVRRPVPWRDLARLAAIVVGVVAVSAMLPGLLRLAGAPAPGSEYTVLRLLKRFAFLQVTDWSRLAYLVVPAGMVPALALLAWRRQDGVARALTLTAVASFLFAFVQLHAPLHYYVPAMLLPLAVYWRVLPDERQRRRAWHGAALVGSAGAIALAWPSAPGPYQAARVIGGALQNAAGSYDRMTPAHFRATQVMQAVIPFTWDPRVPRDRFGGSAIAFNHYASRRSSGMPAYLVQADSVPPPPGALMAGAEAGFTAYVLAPATWAEHLAMRPPRMTAPLFHQPRGILFRSVPLEDGPYVLDLPAVARRLGVDVEAMVQPRIEVR